ncbi:hypothetical protein MPNT_40135 [Candidatus Methylacidithermus pantelleriae]|uniref:Uncharacterized protein n=1 Tax=Candidatus Methylacidithermus pantelleriae TaxID=2744239 RepID=A0A8J2BJY9_9BACT|nr:hypothetical protein MPNT_40135 [Candidatus Methylacidithermus pantelleriae]
MGKRRLILHSRLQICNGRLLPGRALEYILFEAQVAPCRATRTPVDCGRAAN